MRKLLQRALNRVVITAIIVLFQIGFFLLEILRWGNCLCAAAAQFLCGSLYYLAAE